MSLALNKFLIRLGRWPRRIAVLACVILAGSSAISEHSSHGARRTNPLDRLQTGQVAVPVSLATAGVAGVIEPGQHVGLLSSHSLLADHLLVLKVSGEVPGQEGTTGILVAADRPTALRIAKSSTETVLAVVDKSS